MRPPGALRALQPGAVEGAEQEDIGRDVVGVVEADLPVPDIHPRHPGEIADIVHRLFEEQPLPMVLLVRLEPGDVEAVEQIGVVRTEDRLVEIVDDAVEPIGDHLPGLAADGDVDLVGVEPDVAGTGEHEASLISEVTRSRGGLLGDDPAK